MGIRIGTNVSSLTAQRNVRVSGNALSSSEEKLASGSRINSAGDDAAGLSISENLRSKVRSLAQSIRNSHDAVGLIQTAEGAMNEISSNVIRIRELAMQAASDTVGDPERGMIDKEVQQLKSEIDRTIQTTRYNGRKVLSSSLADPHEFQVGIHNDPETDRLEFDRALAGLSLARMSIEDLSVGDKLSAQTALSEADAAISQVSKRRSYLGALQNELGAVIQNTVTARENLSAGNSRIRDTDMATETAERARAQIMHQSSVSILSQANQTGNVALRLINGA